MSIEFHENVPERAGIQDDAGFSAWDLLRAPQRPLRVTVLIQNHYAHYAAAAGSLARSLHQAGHTVTVVPMSWASSPMNSHIRSALGRYVPSFPTPDKQVAEILLREGAVRVEDSRGLPSDIHPDNFSLPHSSALTLSELATIEGRGLPVGSAVRDELIRRGHGSHPDVRVSSRFAHALAANYFAVFDRVGAILRDLPTDLLVIFNGRYVPEAAAQLSARIAGVDVAYYEAGGLLRDYDFFGHETHDIAALCERTAALANQGCSAYLIEELAELWYRPRRELAAPDVSRLGMRASTRSSQINKDLDVIYFSSSSDELEFNVASGVEAEQRRSLEFLRAACARTGMHLTIRTHPNMRTKSSREQSDWSTYLTTLPGVSVIDQHANVDSYSLAVRARAVVTFASTIGIEAMRLGVPTLITGPAIYSRMPGVATATTEDEIVNFLDAMPMPDRNTADFYGAFQMLRGVSAGDLDLGARDEAYLLGKRVGGPNSVAEALARSEWRLRNAVIQRLSIH